MSSHKYRDFRINVFLVESDIKNTLKRVQIAKISEAPAFLRANKTVANQQVG